MSLFSRLFRSDAAAAPPAPRADNATTLTLCPTGVSVGGWGNPLSGLGVEGQDPTAQLVYRSGRIPSAITVDRLYTFDWLAARIIELMPAIAMVRGFTIADQKDKGIELIRAFEKLNTSTRFPMGAFQRAVNDGRAYGGAELLKGYALGSPLSQLAPEQQAGGIKFLDVFGQHELRCLKRFNDSSEPNFGLPELYEVIGTASGPPHPRLGQIFHTSRSIHFSGLPLRLPNTSTDLVGDYPEIGISVLTPVLGVLGQYGLAWAAVSNLLQDASIGVMKLSGLVESLGSEDHQLIRDRLVTLQQTKAANRMMFLDADNNEEYSRTEVSLTDIPALVQQFMVALAGSAGVPARMFFSSSPSGLNSNASGDADLKQLYNDCSNYQRRYLGPKLEEVLADVLPGGAGEVHVEWPSLWDSSQNEQAQTRTAQANADKTYYDMGYSAKQIGVARAKGTVVELTGEEPEDSREDVAAAGKPEPGEDAPEGAPGADGAAAIATKQRAAQSAGAGAVK